MVETINLFILDKNFNVLGTLSNNGDFSKIIPYYEDLYTQDLVTGAETFEFTTSSYSKNSQYLTVGNYVAFKYNSEYKLFNIVSIEENHEETLEKTVYCEMAGIELINQVVRPMKVVNNSVKKFLESILFQTDWQLGKIDAGFTQVMDFEITEHHTVYELIQEHVVGTFGAEISYRVEIENNEVTGKYIDIYKQRGRDNGYRFAYSKNIETISRTIDSSELVTALIGEGKNGLTFKEVDLPDKPINQDFIANETAYKQWNLKGTHLMGVYKCDTESPQELLRLTRIALEERSQPKAKYEVKVALIDKNLKIGDTVNIVDHEFNPPLYLSGRVTQLKTSVTDPNKDECILSNFKELKSNITDEMRKLASQLEGYVDSQFPIGSSQIQNGAVGKEQFSKQYHTEIVADAVHASLVETEDLIAGKADIGDLHAVNASIENLQAENAEITGKLNATKAEIENLKSENVEITGSLLVTNAKVENLFVDKANITDLNATNAKVDSLQADKASINQLDATKAEIKELVATKAEIDDLHAVSGKIDVLESSKANVSDLNAMNATIGSLQANKADIGDLHATNATISLLNALVAQINTLVGGNLTMDNIQSLILSSDKVSVEDAFIKDAMIESINAGKISSGSIDTGEITITSKDGGIEIIGNTQKFKDKNGIVRIQIGRDKNNNFTFSLFDETGKGVLIDHTGVKEDALADNIIKENMVSENAIGEKQINYNSFVTGFNKDTNTNTIKATKVMLDSQQQTLEVGFRNLKSQSDDTKTKTENNITTLNVHQGKIESLISDTTIEKDGKNIKIKDAYSKLEQTVDSFGVTMGEHTTKISQIEEKSNNALNKAINAENVATGISGRVEEVESKQSTLKQDLDGFKSSVSKDYATKTELTTTNNKLGTLEGTVNTTNSKVATLETSLDGINQRVSSTESTTVTLTNKVTTAQNTANTAKNTADSAKSTATSAQNTANSANTNATDALNKANSANSKIDNLQIGGRNLIKDSNFMAQATSSTVAPSKSFGLVSGLNLDETFLGKTVTFSYFVHCVGERTAGSVSMGNRFGIHGSVQWRNKSTGNISTHYPFANCLEGSFNNTRVSMQYTFNPPSGYDTIHSFGFAYQPFAKPSSTNSEVWKIGQPKLEIGNKATDWTPAPEDVQSQIDTHTTQISTTTNKVSSIETNLSGITSRVTNVENKTTTIEGKVNSHESRLTTAESKITDKAIINTVSSTIDNKVSDGIKNVQIGDRNLLLMENVVNRESTNFSKDGYTVSFTHRAEWQGIQFLNLRETMELGKEYCLQYKIKKVEGTLNGISHHVDAQFEIIDYVVDGKLQNATAHVGNMGMNDTNWHTCTLRVKRKTDATGSDVNRIIPQPNRGSATSVTVEMKDFKISQGNKFGDWSPAPEDVEKQLSDIETMLNGNIDNAISGTKSEILDDVSKNYANKEIVTQLQETVDSKFEQTSTDISMQFNTAQNYTKEVDGKLQDYQNTVATHIRFSENGIDLGKTNSPFSATLDNTKLAFKQNQEEVAYISNNKMYITQAEVKESLRIGKSGNGFFTWIQGSEGNLSLKWSES